MARSTFTILDIEGSASSRSISFNILRMVNIFTQWFLGELNVLTSLDLQLLWDSL